MYKFLIKSVISITYPLMDDILPMLPTRDCPAQNIPLLPQTFSPTLLLSLIAWCHLCSLDVNPSEKRELLKTCFDGAVQHISARVQKRLKVSRY